MKTRCHRNAMRQRQDMAPHPVTVYRHGADLWLCYPLMWNVALKYTATHFNVLVRPDREILPRPSTHTSERDAVIKVIISWKLYRKYRTDRVLNQ